MYFVYIRNHVIEIGSNDFDEICKIGAVAENQSAKPL